MGTVGLQGDATWSTGRNVSDGWPEQSVVLDSDNKDWPTTQQSPAFTDLVPEFEPGKPWKGTQMKNIEDDPSITPGSVARSPLSISAAKETDLFAGSSKTSPTEIQPISLSSSTWSFNPGSQQNFNRYVSIVLRLTPPKIIIQYNSSTITKHNTNKTNSWSDPVSTQTQSSSELWGAPINQAAPRGPPPGLSANRNGANSVLTPSGNVSSANGWMGLGGGNGGNGAGVGGGNGNGGSNNGRPNNVPNNLYSSPNTNIWYSSSSTWLLLKNLTSQVLFIYIQICEIVP